MGRETQTVGFSKDARQINCTDEEARILLRKDLPRYGGPKPRGPVRALLGFLILNRGAAIFFGTLGYWFFGILTIGWAQEGVSATRFMSTGIHPLDMVVTNPMVMATLSFFLLAAGVSRDQDEPSLFGGLGLMVMMISLPFAYLGSMLMGAIFFITLPFALNSSASYEMGTLIMFLLPAGYLALIKMAEFR